MSRGQRSGHCSDTAVMLTVATRALMLAVVVALSGCQIAPPQTSTTRPSTPAGPPTSVANSGPSVGALAPKIPPTDVCGWLTLGQAEEILGTRVTEVKAESGGSEDRCVWGNERADTLIVFRQNDCIFSMDSMLAQGSTPAPEIGPNVVKNGAYSAHLLTAGCLVSFIKTRNANDPRDPDEVLQMAARYVFRSAVR